MTLMARRGLLAATVGAASFAVFAGRDAAGASRAAASSPARATLAQALASPRDLWGEAALSQPEGPSYEFFRGLLPPLRYVDTPFRYYPVVLSAPGAPVKARLISNGSGLNLLARQPNWRGESGIPVHFTVGGLLEPFGEDLRRLDGPRYADGYLPIVHLRYRQGRSVYEEEAFASIQPDEARAGVVYVRFRLTGPGPGRISAQVEGATPWIARGGTLRNAQGQVVTAFGPAWQFNLARNVLTASLRPGESAVLAIPAQPLDAISAPKYDPAREACIRTWQGVLTQGMTVDVPEPVVDHAWKSLVCGSYALLNGDDIRYSAGNQYAKLYIGEGGDALRSLLLWGHEADTRRMIAPLFDYTRKGLEFHQAAFKLQMLAHCYWITRDRSLLPALRPRIDKELGVLLNGTEPGTGLFPREKYCGDIDTRVYSLNSNANGWRALRDMQSVFADAGDPEAVEKIRPRATAMREAILSALDKSIRRDESPAFVPVALFGEEAPYHPITAAKMGSYYNLMAPYVLGSGVFPATSKTADALIGYLQANGGLCMGMTRNRGLGWWVAPQGLDDLYGLRYTLALLQRDEPDRALVTFYGKLAQGMTRDTFLSAEGTCLTPADAFGRQMYLPPNSAGNALFLTTLRNLLIQDLDANDDGRPETLRLLFATPRRWLRDGATLRLRNAPTTFGPLSLSVVSELAKGRVTIVADLPPRRPDRTLLRLRLPSGWRLGRVTTDGRVLRPAGAETIDLTGLTGHVVLRAVVGHY